MKMPPDRLWYTPGDGGSLASVLAVGPGPPPLQKSVWLHFLALPSEASGGWAMVNYPLLGPLDDITDGSNYEGRVEDDWQYAEADSNGMSTAIHMPSPPLRSEERRVGKECRSR